MRFVLIRHKIIKYWRDSHTFVSIIFRKRLRELLHALQPFPADIPGAILWETGVERLLATIPTGTHHGDGGE